MTLFKCQMYLARTALIGDTFQIELEFRNLEMGHPKQSDFIQSHLDFLCFGVRSLLSSKVDFVLCDR